MPLWHTRDHGDATRCFERIANARKAAGRAGARSHPRRKVARSRSIIASGRRPMSVCESATRSGMCSGTRSGHAASRPNIFRTAMLSWIIWSTRDTCDRVMKSAWSHATATQGDLRPPMPCKHVPGIPGCRRGGRRVGGESVRDARPVPQLGPETVDGLTFGLNQPMGAVVRCRWAATFKSPPRPPGWGWAAAGLDAILRDRQWMI